MLGPHLGSRSGLALDTAAHRGVRFVAGAEHRQWFGRPAPEFRKPRIQMESWSLRRKLRQTRTPERKRAPRKRRAGNRQSGETPLQFGPPAVAADCRRRTFDKAWWQ